MIFASGYVEANELKDVEPVITELKNRNIEVEGVNGEKIVFIIERDIADLVKTELDNIKNITGVRNVYLSYFSLEHEGEEILEKSEKTQTEIVGIIVQVNEGLRDVLIKDFEAMPNINIYGMKDNQIVLILDTDDLHVLTQKIQEITKMNGVIRVYPIFSRESLPF